jgi:4-cresol dehydrogenase (hydroxylating)
MGYPWARAGDQVPLPAVLRERLRDELDIGAWNVAGSLTGTGRSVAALRRDVRRHMRPYKVVFLGDRKLALAREATALFSRFGLGRRLARRLEAVTPVYGLLKGIPTDEPLRGASWRVRDVHGDPPLDPLDGHAGLLWVSPVLPATGPCASEVTGLVETVLQKHRFDPCMTFSFIADRALICVANNSFDRRRPDEAAAAGAAYDELTDALMRAGYVPYRCAPEGMGKLVDPADVYWGVAGQIKRALDPNGIISAGRYESPPSVSQDFNSRSAA